MAFLKMREAATKDNVELLAVSCYRPAKANATSTNHFAVATNSSHGYGLAIDLQLSVDSSHTADGKSFKVSEVNTHDPANLMKYYQSSVMKWMAMNGQRFDFHPYENEPWHFEYNPDGMAADMVTGAKAWKRRTPATRDARTLGPGDRGGAGPGVVQEARGLDRPCGGIRFRRGFGGRCGLRIGDRGSRRPGAKPG